MEDSTRVAIHDHIKSDMVDIYTITAVLIKDYNTSKNWAQQLVRSLASFCTQTIIPSIVFYSLFVEWIHDVCPATGTWEDRTVTCVMSMFLLVHYIRKWVPFLYGLTTNEHLQDTSNEGYGIVAILLNKNSHLYLSEFIFVIGVFGNMLSVCINTAACLVLMFQTTNPMEIVVMTFAMYYLHDLPPTIST